VRKPEKKLRVQTRRAAAAILPNMLTLGNAVCGFGAIVFIAGASSNWSTGDGLFAAFRDGKLVFACWLIFAGMIFDALDGAVARMTRQSSNLGAQLDSLSDAVTFTVAPAFLVWKVISLLPLDIVHIPRKVAWVLAVLYMVCGILRLARFNVETADDAKHKGFHGLPSPAAAAVIASLTLLAVDIFVEGGGKNVWVPHAFFLAIPVIAFFLGILMVSRVPYPHVLNRLIRGRRPFAYLVQLVFLIAILALLPYSVSLALLASLYVVSGLALYTRDWITARKPAVKALEIQEPLE